MIYVNEDGHTFGSMSTGNCKKDCVPDLELFSQEIVKVEGFSEVLLDADVVEFTVTVQMTKSTVEDVKQSVSKRIEYIIYVLNKCNVKGEDAIQNHQVLIRVGNDFRLTEEISVKCSSLNIFEDISNTLTVKLGGFAIISSPRLKHSPESLFEAREKAVRLAVENARRKASQMARVSGQDVGTALYLEEKESRQELNPYGVEHESEITRKLTYKFISRVFAVYTLINCTE